MATEIRTWETYYVYAGGFQQYQFDTEEEALDKAVELDKAGYNAWVMLERSERYQMYSPNQVNAENLAREENLHEC